MKVTGENFEAMTRERWNLISRRACDAWSDDAKTVLIFSFEMLIYIHRRVAANAPVAVWRATTSRIEQSVCQINAYNEQNNTRLDPITQQHFSIHHARQYDGTGFAISTDKITRPAQLLDERHNDVIRQNTEADDERNKKEFRLS